MNEKKLTEMRCQLTDCIFYAGETGDPGVLYCKHPDVEFHQNDDRCPLYRVDWARKLGAAELLTKRIKNV